MQEIFNTPSVPGIKAPVQPPSLVATLQSFITGSSVPNVPQAMLQAPPGQLVTAVVLAVNPKNQILVQTPQGQVAFESPVALKVGQQLVLETLPRQALPQRVPGSPPPPPASLPVDVKLVRVNGVTAESVYPQAANSATNTPETNAQSRIQAAIGGLVLRAITPPPARQGEKAPEAAQSSLFETEASVFEPSPLQNRAPIRATLLSIPAASSGASTSAQVIQQTSADPFAGLVAGEEAPEATADLSEPLPALLRQLRPGDQLTVRVQGGTLALPAATGGAMPVEDGVGTTAAPAAGSGVSAEIAEAFDAASPAAGNIRRVPIEPQAAPPREALGLNLPLNGTVIGREPDGSPILQTKAGMLRLSPEVPIPVGSELQMSVLEVEPALNMFQAYGLPMSGMQTGKPGTDALLKGSTGLDALYRQLLSQSPDDAAELRHAVLPQPGRQFGQKVLQFIAAMKSGELPQMMEQAIGKERLEAAMPPRMMAEMTSLRAAMADAPPQQWSYMLVPVAMGEEMHHMRWFKRRQEPEEAGGVEGTRFVVELETESIGSLQLDGLFFNQPKTKQFDLAVRTSRPFTPEEQQDIAEIYQNYGEVSGYRGQIRFESGTRFPVRPAHDIIEPGNRQISV